MWQCVFKIGGGVEGDLGQLEGEVTDVGDDDVFGRGEAGFGLSDEEFFFGGRHDVNLSGELLCDDVEGIDGGIGVVGIDEDGPVG